MNIGGLYRLIHQSNTFKHQLNLGPQYYTIYDNKPELENNTWMGVGYISSVGHLLSHRDIFVLLEYSEANDCMYPKILTTTGIIGYLYLSNKNERLEEVTNES